MSFSGHLKLHSPHDGSREDSNTDYSALVYKKRHEGSTIDCIDPRYQRTVHAPGESDDQGDGTFPTVKLMRQIVHSFAL
eukprot:gene12184-14114_t